MAGVVHIPASSVQWLLFALITDSVCGYHFDDCYSEARRDLSVFWFGFI